MRYGEAEILEAEVLETSPLLGKSLKELKLPKGIVAGALARGGEVIVPRGGTRFDINDRVVLLALASIIKKVEKLFAVRVEFF